MLSKGYKVAIISHCWHCSHCSKAVGWLIWVNSFNSLKQYLCTAARLRLLCLHIYIYILLDVMEIKDTRYIWQVNNKLLVWPFSALTWFQPVKLSALSVLKSSLIVDWYLYRNVSVSIRATMQWIVIVTHCLHYICALRNSTECTTMASCTLL